MMAIKEGHFRAFKKLISDSRTNLNLQEKVKQFKPSQNWHVHSDHFHPLHVECQTQCGVFCCPLQQTGNAGFAVEDQQARSGHQRYRQLCTNGIRTILTLLCCVTGW